MKKITNVKENFHLSEALPNSYSWLVSLWFHFLADLLGSGVGGKNDKTIYDYLGHSIHGFVSSPSLVSVFLPLQLASLVLNFSSLGRKVTNKFPCREPSIDLLIYNFNRTSTTQVTPASSVCSLLLPHLAQ